MQEWRNQPDLFWKTFTPLLPSGKVVILQKNPKRKALEQTKCSSPAAEPQVEHQPLNSLRVPAAQHPGDFLLPPWQGPEEALHFLKPEHEVLSPGFFRRVLPFMLHRLLEAFVWNENIWKKPLQVSPA